MAAASSSAGGGGPPADFSDVVPRQARPDVRRAEAVRVAGPHHLPGALQRFLHRPAAVVDAGQQVRMHVHPALRPVGGSGCRRSRSSVSVTVLSVTSGIVKSRPIIGAVRGGRSGIAAAGGAGFAFPGTSRRRPRLIGPAVAPASHCLHELRQLHELHAKHGSQRSTPMKRLSPAARAAVVSAAFAGLGFFLSAPALGGRPGRAARPCRPPPSRPTQAGSVPVEAGRAVQQRRRVLRALRHRRRRRRAPSCASRRSRSTTSSRAWCSRTSTAGGSRPSPTPARTRSPRRCAASRWTSPPTRRSANCSTSCAGRR